MEGEGAERGRNRQSVKAGGRWDEGSVIEEGGRCKIVCKERLKINGKEGESEREGDEERRERGLMEVRDDERVSLKVLNNLNLKL